MQAHISLPLEPKPMLLPCRLSYGGAAPRATFHSDRATRELEHGEAAVEAQRETLKEAEAALEQRACELSEARASAAAAQVGRRL